MPTGPDITAGAANLLTGCAGLRGGERVLVMTEAPEHGFYSADLAPAVIRAARALGCDVEIFETGYDPEPAGIPPDLRSRMGAADRVISLSRLGDQLRFDGLPDGVCIVQCYALDAASLDSGFGAAPYGAFVALKAAVDRALHAAQQIRITCAQGTDVRGRAPKDVPPSDTTCLRFPLSVFSPVLARGFSGKVALPGFLTGTGSRYYAPFTVEIPKGVFAHLYQGTLAEFSGPAAGVARAEAHYDLIAARYGLDRNAVHSWHAGLHPGCGFAGNIEESYERWGGSAFGNPRILHFHTCGADPPGEICWNVIDPTITVDGVALWQDGRFHAERIPQARQVLHANPEVAALFYRPDRAIGLS